MRGNDTMPVIKTFTFKDGYEVEQVPDGRRCITCPFTDDSYCPISVKVLHIRRFIKWKCGPDRDSGATKDYHCGFCWKYYNSYIRRSQVLAVTMAQYEETLASSTENMEQHQHIIAQRRFPYCSAGADSND